MIVKPFPNINGSRITVTSTATSLYELIKTAAGVNTDILAPTDAALDALDINCETGDVSVSWDGITPTSTDGDTLKNDQLYTFRGRDLANLKLVSVTGSDEYCSITYGYSN